MFIQATTLLSRALGQPPAPTPAAPRPAAPAPTAPMPADTLALSPRAAVRRAGEVRLAPGQDALAVTVAKGDTLWRLATRWGAPNATRAYIEAIRRENGLEGDTIALGQTLRMPYDAASAGLNLLIALAVHKDHAARGQAAPAIDATGVAVGYGPLDSYLVTAPRRDGKGLAHYAVYDDQSGEDTFRWVVEPIDQRTFEARKRGDL